MTMLKYDYFRTETWFWHGGGYGALTADERAIVFAPVPPALPGETPREHYRRIDAFNDERSAARDAANRRARQAATLAERWEQCSRAMRKFKRHVRSQRNRGWRYDPSYRQEQDALRDRKFGVESRLKYALMRGPYEDWPEDAEDAEQWERALYVLECQRVGVSYRRGEINIASGGDYIEVCGECINLPHIAGDIELVVIQRDDDLPSGICEECHRAFGDMLQGDDDDEYNWESPQEDFAYGG